MNLLYLVGSAPCSHCYGADFLYAGFCAILGHEHVFDMPEKPNLHLTNFADRDECNIDSDACFPLKPSDLEDVDFDLAIMAIQPSDDSRFRLRDVCRQLPATLPIAAYDPSDMVSDTRAVFEEIAGRPLAAFFKREIPLAAPWDAHPLPLSYPASRVPDERGRVSRVVYHATTHGDSGPGLPRMRIVERLRAALRPEQMDIGLYPSQQGRPSPEECRARMSQGAVGIAWNGYPYVEQYDNNRLWQNFACGLAQVAERPRIKIEQAPEHGLHCLYAQSPDELAEYAIELVNEPPRAAAMGFAGQQHFLRWHSSEARARRVLEVLHHEA